MQSYFDVIDYLHTISFEYEVLSQSFRPTAQGWISDMGIDQMVPPLSQKWLIFTSLGQGLSEKVGFFLIFEPILRGGFFDKMPALSNKKSTFVLVSGFSGCCVFTVFD